jgi:hypothetical protein
MVTILLIIYDIFTNKTPFGSMALVLQSYVEKWRNYTMKEMNSAMFIEATYIESEETLVPSVKNESMEGSSDHYDEPGFFFRGAVFGLLLCLPFWIVIFWLIIR